MTLRHKEHPLPMLYDVTDDWLREHGIGREEIDAHGIKRYSKDDTADVEAEYRAQLPNPGQLGVMTRWARTADGLLIRHHAPSWMDLPQVVTQIRPDVEIRTGERQRHNAHHDARFWQFHIARHPDHGAQKHLSDAEVEALTDAELRALRDKGVVRGNVEHDHWEKAKYLHAPGPRDWQPHDHADLKPKARDFHERKDHSGQRVDGTHEHRVKDTSVKYATRIDVSPLLTEADFERADRFYLIIEGSIKMLAVLTWVRAAGENAVVMSVPAVGQWNAPELWEIAERYMAGDRCLIIADSDAHRNAQVMRETVRLRRRLRRRDVDTDILLPPEDCLGPGEKVGADDALGKAGVSLYDFQVIHRDPAYAGITRLVRETQGWREKSWRELREPSTVPRNAYERDTTARIQIKAHTLPNRTRPGRTRNLDVLIALSEQANLETGLYWGSLRGLEGDLGLSHASALEAIGELEGEFIERLAGLLETEESEYSFARDYLERPTWRIHEDIRAIQSQQRYGDFLEERKENDGRNGSAPGAGVSGALRDSAEDPAPLPE
jgi:hypothetical protein